MGVILRKAVEGSLKEGTPHTHGGDSNTPAELGRMYEYSPYSWG